jgi:hypothetical protein
MWQRELEKLPLVENLQNVEKSSDLRQEKNPKGSST